MTPSPPDLPPHRWALALLGLATAVFAVVALSGPGRIDICDGQTRFETGRSLVEHGDTAVRDPRVVWVRFPGRDGLDFTNYRFPQTLVAAGCILLADATGPPTEGRRHFVFALHGAVAAAGLAVLYAVFFRRGGLSPRAAIGWAAAGVFCSPNWYYATSTFDDILGSLTVVALLVVADRSRADRGLARTLLAAGLAGLALNCKPPLAAFVLPAMAAADDPARSPAARLLRAGLLAAGVAAGQLGYQWYDDSKFPPEVRPRVEAIIRDEYPAIFFGNPAAALLDFTAGPSSGAVWYFPPVWLVALGLAAWAGRGRRGLALAWVAAAAAVVGFCSLMTFYKGDVAWGPRYLTPVFAAGWLFVPAGATRLARPVVGFLLAAGVLVQLLALSLDPLRLYVWRSAPSGVFQVSPWAHFHTAIAHLPNRFWELADAATAPPAPEFTPAPAPTFGIQGIDPPFLPEKGPAVVRRYQVFNGFRPWWAALPHLPPGERPIDPAEWAAGLTGLVAAGGLLLAAGLRPTTTRGES